ncbi:hypothetical protein [Paenibacillus sp. Root444D2]|uniref:hypothetical protein n=1 Tax=Paenibacillus sp. Root444D2 TaxID=1736538 RepID=UPI00070C48DB|nr:hypothetical protein [Paenibacillus sp. Root444D2]KQX69295.1 hypothetical protein ASD40_01990 [Paenibacillus sp. Root444D2]
MDNYELFKKNSGIEISREDFEAGVSFMNGKMEGHPALITALQEHAWAVAAPYIKRVIERQLIQSHNADAKNNEELDK